MNGGLTLVEFGELLKVLLKSGQTVGMYITIFNHNLDKDGLIVSMLISSIVKAFHGTYLFKTYQLI